MSGKTLSIVSYITLIGWLIACFMGKDNADILLKYHLRQLLGLKVVDFIFNIVIAILVYFMPALSIVSLLVFIVLFIIGLNNAAGEKKRHFLLLVIGS